ARKRAQARIYDGPTPEPPDLGAPADERLHHARLEAALVASVDELSEPIRTAVLLRYQQGFSFEEMGRICGEKPATLQMRVARALPVLRASILLRTRVHLD